MKEAAIKFTSDLETAFKSWLGSEETKAAIAEAKNAPDSATGTFEVIITTENLDRYQEVISLAGWELEHYRNNPVVLWGHDHHQLPIGVATSVEIVDGKMIAKGKFAPHAFAQTIRQLHDMGMMRATSVGFIEKEREGNLITKAELLEFSFVSVPANPYALSRMVKDGVSVNEMVTKGLVFVEREAPEEEPTVPEEKPDDQPETPENEPVQPDQPMDEPVTPAEPSEDQKELAAVVAKEVISQLKDLGIIALEASAGEPERSEDEPEATEDEKQFADFSAKRKTIQDAATILGDVLAEARQAMQAKQ